MIKDNQQNKPICLFDSGIGGLTVLKKLINKFPNENYIYLADLARVPFGDKTKEEIKKIVNEIIEWLVRFEPKMIIMACNTSSTVLYEQGRIYPAPTTPIYGMIESCTKEIAKSNHKKISVWATKFVVENNAYKKMIQNNNSNINVEEITCQKLVPMIEGLSFTLVERNKIIQEYLDQTSKDSERLILGCTHYPLISEDIKKLTSIKIINPTDYLIDNLEKAIIKNGLSNKSQISLYTTAQKEKLERFARLYIQKDTKVSLVDLNMVSVSV